MSWQALSNSIAPWAAVGNEDIRDRRLRLDRRHSGSFPGKGALARAKGNSTGPRHTGRWRNFSKCRDGSGRCCQCRKLRSPRGNRGIGRPLTGSEKPLIHTSGSSIVYDYARGDFESPKIYHDDSYIQPLPIREARVAIDRFVRTSGISLGIRAIVICPTTIYGAGRGLKKDSDQFPG
jgi:hypothetical protein